MSNVDVLAVLSALNGNGFVGVDTETVPVLKGGKKNPMQGRVKKVVSGSQCQMFQNKYLNGYEEMVRRRLNAEGKNGTDFQLGSRAWGSRIEGLPLVEHKGKYYLELIYQNSGNVQYLLDGEPIAKEEIEGLDDKPEGAQGGLSDKVIIRTIALENVRGLRYGGQEYKGNFVVGDVGGL